MKDIAKLLPYSLFYISRFKFTQAKKYFLLLVYLVFLFGSDNGLFVQIQFTNFLILFGFTSSSNINVFWNSLIH